MNNEYYYEQYADMLSLIDGVYYVKEPFIHRHGMYFIPGYSNYGLDDLGKIYDVSQECAVELPLPNVRETSYRKITLFDDYTGKNNNVPLHKLAALAYCPYVDEDHRVVNHRNGNKLDNSRNNIERTTSRMNLIHAFREGLNLSVPKQMSCSVTSETGTKHEFETVRAMVDFTGISYSKLRRAYEKGESCEGWVVEFSHKPGSKEFHTTFNSSQVFLVDMLLGTIARCSSVTDAANKMGINKALASTLANQPTLDELHPCMGYFITKSQDETVLTKYMLSPEERELHQMLRDERITSRIEYPYLIKFKGESRWDVIFSGRRQEKFLMAKYGLSRHSLSTIVARGCDKRVDVRPMYSAKYKRIPSES